MHRDKVYSIRSAFFFFPSYLLLKHKYLYFSKRHGDYFSEIIRLMKRDFERKEPL